MVLDLDDPSDESNHLLLDFSVWKGVGTLLRQMLLEID